MLLPFFTALREAKVPVSLKEWLHLMEAMDKGVAGRDVGAFYHLSRAGLAKAEQHYDRFGQGFGRAFQRAGGMGPGEGTTADVPEALLRLLTARSPAAAA